MPVKEALACIGVLGVSLLLVGFTFAPATASLSGSPAMRTWFFHNQLSNSGWTYAMNETSPKLHTDDRSEGLGFFYFGTKSGSSLYDQTRTGFNLTFALAPGYPYGFDFIPGTALLDLWMQGQGGYNFPPTKLYAQFNFTLSGPTEQTLGTTLATLVLQANSANSISPWNHTSVPLPI